METQILGSNRTCARYRVLCTVCCVLYSVLYSVLCSVLLYCTVVYHCTTVLLSTVDEACKRDSVWAGETLAPSESYTM